MTRYRASQSEYTPIDTTQINRVESDNERTVRKRGDARKQELLRLAVIRRLLADRQNVCGTGGENGDSCLIEDDVDNENNTYEYDSEPSETKADGLKEALHVVEMAPLKYFREQMFEEGEDPQWSPEAEQGIEDKLADAQFLDMKNQEVSCSANVCKVTLQFNSLEGLDRTLEKQHEEVASLSPWESKGLLTSDRLRPLGDGSDMLISLGRF